MKLRSKVAKLVVKADGDMGLLERALKHPHNPASLSHKDRRQLDKWVRTYTALFLDL